MYQRSLAVLLLLAFAAPIFGQTAATQPDSKPETDLRKEAVAFLRETMADVQNMRTLENRISFSAELAGLMWYHDENEARTMFNTAIGDFRELIARLDAQMNALPEEGDVDEKEAVAVVPFLMTGDEAKLRMKYQVAMAVRQQIATSIAEHDPDVAFAFFHDTASSNPKVANFAGRDPAFEVNLLKEIAMKKPEKAAQHAVKSLEKGFEYYHVDLLRKISEKDGAIAAEFGSAVLKKVKEKDYKAYDLYTVGLLMDFASENFEASKKPGGKKAVYTQAEMREMADVMATAMLDVDGGGEMGFGYISTIEKYLPAKAAQIRAKYEMRDTAAASNTNASRGRMSGMSNAAVNVAVATASANANSSAASEAREAKRLAEEKLMTDVAKIGEGELPKEQREKVVAQARKILLQTKGKDKQIAGLSMLATQVAKAGDKELAAEIMRDAEGLVSPNPKNYQDFMYTWMLVAGYAESDPEKAFPILESAIGRANDLIHAFVKVGEFIDVTEEMISDGEAQVGAFGGGMIRGLSRELGVAEATLGTLIKADFAKTRALTNRFDRSEVRILAKMLVLRTVLGKKPEVSTEEQVKQAMDQN